MKTTIHVHQQLAKKKNPGEHPAIIIRTYKKSTHHRSVKLSGEVTIVHTQEPDSCGATIVINCDHTQIRECDPPWRNQ
jgi:hypothetical protein